MPPRTGRDQMLERSSNRPDDGKPPSQALAQTFAPGERSVTLQSQADARSELVGAAPTDDETNRKNMALLIQLRWTAVVGQIVTIGGVHMWLGIPLPLTRMGAVIGALIFLNVSSLVWVRHRAAITNNELLVALMLDFVLNAVLLVVFVTRINRNLRERDAHLAALRQHAAEQDHIVRMGLLASGAAHELGTPLASLSVILGDWRRMPDLAADQELAE